MKGKENEGTVKPFSGFHFIGRSDVFSDQKFGVLSH